MHHKWPKNVKIMIRKQTEYTYKFLARIVIEAETPIAVGSGKKEILTDAPVVKDFNGLPYIPASAIAGTMRHVCREYSDDIVLDRLFGFHENKQSEGSLMYFTDALLIGEDGLAVEGIVKVDNSEFYNSYRNLPVRNRVSITHRGVGKSGAKFDNEVVYTGSRFCFEIEMSAKSESDYQYFDIILDSINNKSFRLGGNTRNGLGMVKTVSCKTARFNLSDSNDLQEYLNKSSSLSKPLSSVFIERNNNKSKNIDDKWLDYELKIKPDDFFFFGSGFGDALNVADMVPVREDIIIWNTDIYPKPKKVTKCILIPASSIKGAISHRVAYYYNLLNGRFAGDDSEAKTCAENEAVRALFGYYDSDTLEVKRGNVIFSDVVIEPEDNLHYEKLFNHVSIDYFTGGAIDGALFTDKVDMYNKYFKLNISVRKSAFDNENVKKSFEMALQDICEGLLPLGGSVNRGYGCFTGFVTLNNETNE